MFPICCLEVAFNADNNGEVWLRRRLHFILSLRSHLLVLDLTLDVFGEALEKDLFLLLADSLFLLSIPTFAFRVGRLSFIFTASVDFALAKVLLLKLALTFRIIYRGRLGEVDLFRWLLLSSTLIAVLAAFVAVVVSALLLLLLSGNGCLLQHLFLDLFLGLKLSVDGLALAPSRLFVVEHVLDQELQTLRNDELFLVSSVHVHEVLELLVDLRYLFTVLLLELGTLKLFVDCSADLGDELESSLDCIIVD
jgi:hypothetical protein